MMDEKEEALHVARQIQLEAMFPIYESPSSRTGTIKREYRNIALDLMVRRDESNNPNVKRSCSLALTDLETSCMYAVKAVHQEDK